MSPSDSHPACPPGLSYLLEVHGYVHPVHMHEGQASNIYVVCMCGSAQCMCVVHHRLASKCNLS